MNLILSIRFKPIFICQASKFVLIYSYQWNCFQTVVSYSLIQKDVSVESLHFSRRYHILFNEPCCYVPFPTRRARYWFWCGFSWHQCDCTISCEPVCLHNIKMFSYFSMKRHCGYSLELQTSMAHSDACLTGDHKVAGWIPTTVCLHNILWTIGWILTKFSWYNCDITKNWLDLGDLDLICKVTAVEKLKFHGGGTCFLWKCCY